jgi:PTS system fructose-specific IIC component
LSAATIEAAEWVLLVATGDMDMTRFVGKRVFRSAPAQALQDVEAVLRRGAQEAEFTSPAKPPRLPLRHVRRASSRSPPARPALPTPSWRPRPCSRRPSAWAMNCTSKPRARSARKPAERAAIAEADVVLLAADIEVATERFAGKKIYRCGTGIALKQSEATLKKPWPKLRWKALQRRQGAGQARENRRLQTPADRCVVHAADGGGRRSDDRLSFVFGITAFKEEGTLAAALMQIGGETAFKLMVPLLAGYIAYSIADRPGLAPGMIGGLLASTLGAGFIGGIVAGFLAGYAAKAISRYVRCRKAWKR